ncbi:MAG: twin-arginine translocase subunit TatC [Candidatus Brocadiia bacterium]
MAEGALMSLLEHLGELRRRILRSAFAFLIALIVCFHFGYAPIKYVLVAPLEALDPKTTNALAGYNPLIKWLRPHIIGAENVPPQKLYAMTLMEPFMVRIYMAALGGLILSAPYIGYHAWAFVGAGLRWREKRYVLIYLPFSLVMFIAGMLFAYFAALPVAMLYLPTVDASVGYLLNYLQYFKFIVSILAIFGLLFQLPLVMMVLARLGMVEVKTFSHYRRHAIVLAFVAGALLSPSPEPFSQCLLAIPMCGLYEFGILLCKLAKKRAPAADPV